MSYLTKVHGFPAKMFDPFPLCSTFHLSSGVDGFTVDWTGSSVFVNPPFARGALRLAITKCLLEYLNGKSICLLTLKSAFLDHPLADVILDLGIFDDLG